MVNTSYKIRIYPNKEQREILDNWFRTDRFIYNHFLKIQIDILEDIKSKGIVDKQERKQYMKNNNLYFNKYEASKVLTQMSHTEEYSFLKEAPSTMRSYVLRNLDMAFTKIYKNGSGFPKFKNKFSKQSITIQLQNTFTFNFKSNKKFGLLTIPKMKDIVVSCHYDYLRNNYKNPLNIKINSVTIKKEGNQYFASFQGVSNEPRISHEFENTEIIKDTAIGVDMGVVRQITTSRKNDFNNTEYLRSKTQINFYQSEIKRLTSILNRKRDFHKKNKSEFKFYETKSYIRVKNKLQKIHNKISNIRNHAQHSISNSLLKPNDVHTIVFEDLNIKNMTKNKKHNNVLNKNILDVGMFSIRQKTIYKAKRIGKNVILVPPKNTSLTCSSCGHVSKDNRANQSKFICVNCGFEENADYNAAINILNRGFDVNFKNSIKIQ